MQLVSYGITRRGTSRPHNEDAILFPPAEGRDDKGLRYCLAAVADGVGGSPSGERASSMAVSTLKLSLQQRMMEESGEDPRRLLENLFIRANEAVRREGTAGEHRGLATTLVAALMGDDHLWVASLGDSRAYLVTSQEAKQITVDHTWSAQHAAAGSSGRRPSAPQASGALTKAVGSDAVSSVDTFGPFRLEDGDSVVLSSDGLHDLVTPADLARIPRQHGPTAAANELVDLARAHGSTDDVSIVVMRLTKS